MRSHTCLLWVQSWREPRPSRKSLPGKISPPKSRRATKASAGGGGRPAGARQSPWPPPGPIAKGERKSRKGEKGERGKGGKGKRGRGGEGKGKGGEGKEVKVSGGEKQKRAVQRRGDGKGTRVGDCFTTGRPPRAISPGTDHTM